MKKTVFRNFSYSEVDTFAAFLNEMAAEGWHLKEWKIGLVFEKGEPRNDTYMVEIFPKGNELDTRPEVHTQEFAEYCEVAGWEFVDSKRKYCIFRKRHENAVEILTPEERFETITKEVGRELNFNIVWQVGAVVIFWGQFLGKEFHSWIFQNETLGVLVWVVLLLIITITQKARFNGWRAESRKRLERGQKVHYRKRYRWYEFAMNTGLAIMLLILAASKRKMEVVFSVSVLIILLVLKIVQLCIRFIRPSRDTHQFINIFLVTIPVLIGLLLFGSIYNPKDSEQEAEYLEGFFGNATFGRVTTDGKMRIYNYYESEVDWILDKIWKNKTEDSGKHLLDCTKNWQAEDALKYSDRYYIIRYENQIFEIIDEQGLTQQEIDKIREQFNLR